MKLRKAALDNVPRFRSEPGNLTKPFEDLLTAGGGVAKPTPSVVEGSERLGLRRVDRDDLVETAYLEDLPDLIGQGAECELGVPVAQGFGGKEDGAKAPRC